MWLRLTSLLGIVVLLGLAWAMSRDRRRFPWRTVLCGLGLEVVFAMFILRTSAGASIFAGAQNVVDQLNVYAGEGAKMVFGPLVDGAGRGFVFAITISATIIFISALSALLYHWGILPRVVQGLAWVMRRAMRTSGPESLGAAANIFLGPTEAALLIKPYLARMSSSELMALMATGMSTIASGVMAVYASMGVPAGHLLTASVLCAPAGLLVAKIMHPQERERGAAEETEMVRGEAVNGIDALCRGAGDGVALAIAVLAMLIAFVAAVAMANGLLGWLQGLAGVAEPLTLQRLLGWANAPFAWLIGVAPRDCVLVGRDLGERVVLNEFIGYTSLVEQHKAALLQQRSFVLASYALCGFANLGSIAITIGGIGAMVPERRSELARMGVRSMIAGLIARYLTAAIVGVLL
jgi:CNT family concentrative nucleoside transporter